MKSPRSKTPSKVRSKSPLPLPTDLPTDSPTDSPGYEIDKYGRVIVVDKPKSTRELKLSDQEEKAFESMVRESPKEIPKIKVIEETEKSWHPKSWETDSRDSSY